MPVPYVVTRSFGAGVSARYLYDNAGAALRKARLFVRHAAEFRIEDGAGEPLTLTDLEAIAFQEGRGG